jgi:predicted nucleic acid-binding protein
MNGDRVFVDTNVLVYAHDLDAGEKHQIARELLVDIWNHRAGVLSVQVLQECYVTITRKILHPLLPGTARRTLQDYLSWQVELIDPVSVLTASRIEEESQISFWDALIVTAALNGKASKILTEDLQSGQVIEGVMIENPFLGVLAHR